MFAVMKPYAAPLPPGAQPPPLWGNQDHVSALLGDRVSDVTAQRKAARVDRFPTAEAFRDFFKNHYGPTIAAYRNIAGDPDRIEALTTNSLTLPVGTTVVRERWIGSTCCSPPVRHRHRPL
jgi:hypothetical protein